MYGIVTVTLFVMGPVIFYNKTLSLSLSLFLLQHGQIHCAVKGLVQEKFGEEAWSAIL